VNEQASPIAEQLRSAIGLHQRGQVDQAQAIYEEILRTHSGHADALHLLSIIAYQRKQFGKAIELIDRAIMAGPENAVLYANRGVALRHLKQLEAAIADYDKALALKPDYAEAYYNRGNALRELKKPEAAIADYGEAVALKTDYAEAYNNRGFALHELRESDAAIADFDKAISLKPDYAEAYWNKAMISLLRGDFVTGFRLYEWRWKNPLLNMVPRRFAQPLWLGAEPLYGKRILLHSEQGLGDTIQFCRYAPQVARAGGRVILQVPSPLVGLLKNLEGASEVLAEGEPLPDFDYHCPLMSLPLAFETVVDSIPDPTPYIEADSDKTRAWQERIGERKNLKVGVVWNGGFRPNQPEVWAVNERRNIPLDMFARALCDLDIDFFSLQKGDPAESEIRDRACEYWPRGNFYDFASDIADFSDTAALVANLDLVVSVDTSTAHLAAALGKPTWILNRFDACWRWLLDRDDSPWYRSVRLYRQDKGRNWEPVLERVAAGLTQLANEHRGGRP